MTSTSSQGRPVRLAETFGIRSMAQLGRDLGTVVRGSLQGKRFQWDLRSAGLLRPRLSLPAYARVVPKDGLAPLYNLFDRTGGGRRYTQRVTRATCRDFRGGRLTYDEHDGSDFVCPVGTPLVAAAPGIVVMVRDQWLRGGLTVGVDHGSGVVTHYTHCSRALAEVGQAVRRGEAIALSGAAGYDLVQFFPWIPPHVHFMSWRDGVAIDPYLAPGESAQPGTWLVDNDPRPSGPLATDADRPSPSAVLAGALEPVADACLDEGLRRELTAVRRDGPALAALLEDALHHDRWAWPAGFTAPALRPSQPAAPVRLTLPLPGSLYRGACFGDSLWSRP